MTLVSYLSIMFILGLVGGQDVATNVVCACTRCNQEKGSANVLEWMRYKFGVNRLREKVLLEHIA